jgi:hypothetical protein
VSPVASRFTNIPCNETSINVVVAFRSLGAANTLTREF